MLTRKPRMLVAIALANKMARSIWAMLTKNQDYQGSRGCDGLIEDRSGRPRERRACEEVDER